jgi:hypothetical protein
MLVSHSCQRWHLRKLDAKAARVAWIGLYGAGAATSCRVQAALGKIGTRHCTSPRTIHQREFVAALLSHVFFI